MQLFRPMRPRVSAWFGQKACRIGDYRNLWGHTKVNTDGIRNIDVPRGTMWQYD